MFGLDGQIASLSDGATFAIVMLVAVLLGLRHATDPDHLAAVTATVAGGQRYDRWQSARLGLAWGTGHALTLFTFGLPVVLYAAYLPAPVQRGTETLVGLMIVGLAVWLLARWRRGLFDVHGHDDIDRPSASRSPRQAFGIGLVHGIGGSAGVGALLLATINNRVYAVAGLALLAIFTAVSMTLLTSELGVTLSSARVRDSLHRIIPALGLASLAFGAWYALGALELVPYYA